jgi:hypothetical protein
VALCVHLIRRLFLPAQQNPHTPARGSCPDASVLACDPPDGHDLCLILQSVAVEFVVRNQQCPDCQAFYATGAWKAIVQVSQQATGLRRTPAQGCCSLHASTTAGFFLRSLGIIPWKSESIEEVRLADEGWGRLFLWIRSGSVWTTSGRSCTSSSSSSSTTPTPTPCRSRSAVTQSSSAPACSSQDGSCCTSSVAGCCLG